jgi:redox-sensitive bicupin YhaK (pirin superfamily)
MEIAIQAQRRSLGGFEVGRVLPQAPRRMVGPFVFFDHMGPVDFPPNMPHETDVRPHPHIGLGTVTYLLDGEITHRDSVGSEQVIRPGEVNWMTAGRGITHSERFEGMRAGGGPMDGIQTWIGLPEADEEADPGFEHYGAADLPTWRESGLQARLIAGTAHGERSPVKTFSPLFYIHAHLDPGGRVGLPSEHVERAAYVARGRIEAEGREYGHGDMLIFAPNDPASIRAMEPSDVMLLGGDPIGPRHLYWNFVSSSRERIEQAKADWRAGRFALPIHDQAEKIPLPEEPPPPKPEPMS